jgi:hypothetical protein
MGSQRFAQWVAFYLWEAEARALRPGAPTTAPTAKPLSPQASWRALDALFDQAAERR